MLMLAMSLFFGACDLSRAFGGTAGSWTAPAERFVTAFAGDGFRFADGSRTVANCLKRGGCTWHGIEVWEARVYYGADGRANRVEMSLYNRGDDRSGRAMGAADLEALLSRVASSVEPGGEIGSVARRKLKSGGFTSSRRWERTVPSVELAWGYSGEGENLRVDFVRVSLAPARKDAPKLAARPLSGEAARAKARKNVATGDTGDVWIANVPMVDQGAKGYCAVATAERVLRYYGHAVDEHELAQMAGSTAGGGTSVARMVATVKAIGPRYRLGFSEIVSMTSSMRDVGRDVAAYNKAARAEKAPPLDMADFTHGNVLDMGELRAAMQPAVLRRMRLKDGRYRKFLAGVRAQVSQGVPVFWGVTLGIYSEDGLPQKSGGHMRLITGYNEKTHEILYTDSWGAGHELKRMPEDWAFVITHDAFSLRPL